MLTPEEYEAIIKELEDECDQLETRLGRAYDYIDELEDRIADHNHVDDNDPTYY